jgi:hypothetical protein
LLLIAGSPVSILGLIAGLVTIGGLALLWFFSATAWLDLLDKRIELTGRIYRKWTNTTPSYSSQIYCQQRSGPSWVPPRCQHHLNLPYRSPGA